MFNKTLSSGVTNETEIDSIFNENGEIFDNRMIAKVSYGIIGVLAFTSNLVFFCRNESEKEDAKNLLWYIDNQPSNRWHAHG